ncbi:phage recombination protein Bet, partial [Escherichia coli EC1737]
IKL